MDAHLISVCIFCFICATHSPCASHAAFGGHFESHRHQGRFKDSVIPVLDEFPNLDIRQKRYDTQLQDSHINEDENLPHELMENPLKIATKIINPEDVTDTLNNNVQPNIIMDASEYLHRIFLQYGDGQKMTYIQFLTMIKKLETLQILSVRLNHHPHKDLDHHHLHTEKDINNAVSEFDNNNNDTLCFNKEYVSGIEEPLNFTTFSEVCPSIIYSLLSEPCSEHVFNISSAKDLNIDLKIWVYSSLAVLLISICGIGALAIIPLMQKRFYKPLIQFLVALAVGTLAGDALLHLLPHAMSGAEHSNNSNIHEENTWKGLIAMLGLTFFFVMERLILVIGKWRKQHQKHRTVSHAHVQIFNEQGEKQNSTQCMDKYNTSPYCYKDIIVDPISMKSDLQLKNSRSPARDKLETNSNIVEAELISTPGIETKMLQQHDDHQHEDYTVIVREHATDHHGHSHKHGHVHSAPQNYSSVAWMVIMGDGLHNFTDGMAIGAAFASGIAGGFSTTVAVFCHELPHELGDFAMLLKAGMSIRQALFYNLLSSGLCVIGNFAGLYLGNTENANEWIFAAAAGTFIYIALVDMIPELSSTHDDEENLLQYLLHLSGLLLGVGLMTLIALYEHDLKNMFHESM